MKRRLTIARSLVNQPELLLLDEPTTGLDPQARHVLWDRLFRLKQQGVTLVLTTHYMDEAEQLCDRLVVMDGGRIVAEGSPRSLIQRALHARGARAALRRRGPRAYAAADRRPRRARRGAARPDPGLRRRRRGGAGRGARRGLDRSPRSCAAPAWRTSSCGSPAGRWSTERCPSCAKGPGSASTRCRPLSSGRAGHRCGCCPTTCSPGGGCGLARSSRRSSRHCSSWSPWAMASAAWSVGAAGWSKACPTWSS